jgi:hypothetical protein
LSERFDLWLSGLNPKTAKVYGGCLRRLFDLAKVTPDEALEKTRKDIQAYIDLVNASNKFLKKKAGVVSGERARHAAIFGLRRYLYDNGVMMLPPARLTTPTPLKPSTRLTWDQGLAICAAARKPYNLILKLMLHCGWGISEFLKFNTTETWTAIERALKAEPNAEYYRVEFAGRKKNRRQFYTLIPLFLLKEILANVTVPIKASYGFAREKGRRPYKTEGITLDLSNYESSRTYLETAFHTALHRAPVVFNGKPTVHELRDCFRTRATQTECADEAAEFAMGHSVDPLGYRKATYDEKWQWKQLSKIYGPTAASTQQVETLQQENKILKEAVVSALLPQKMNLQKLLDDLVAVELRKHHLRGEAGLESLPPKYVTPAMRELDSQLENINQQLEALGWLKRPESVNAKLRH